MERTEGGKQGSLRAVVVAVMILLLLVGIGYYGIPKPVYRVESSSMFPTHKGPTIRLTCPYCAESFDASIEGNHIPQIHRYRFLECPLCGYNAVPVSPEKFFLGETFTAQKKKSYQRGEILLFQSPEPHGTSYPLTIKRLIGLPGDKIELRRGEVILNGNILSTYSWLHKRKIEIPLHPEERTDRMVLSSLPPIPHQGEGTKGREAQLIPLDNRPPLPHLEPIGGNECTLIRDFVFSALWTGSSEPLKILADQGDILWLVILSQKQVSIAYRENLSGEFSIERITEKEFPEAQTEAPLGEDLLSNRSPLSIEFRFLDRSASVWIDGKKVIQCAEVESIESWKLRENRPIFFPIALIKKEASPPIDRPAKERLSELGFHQIRLTRDLCYTSTKDHPVYTIPENHFFLLGDNSAVSIDSRTWRVGSIPRETILGVVP